MLTLLVLGGPERPRALPDAEHLRGARRGHLSALAGWTWDAVLDTSGYVPADASGRRARAGPLELRRAEGSLRGGGALAGAARAPLADGVGPTVEREAEPLAAWKAR